MLREYSQKLQMLADNTTVISSSKVIRHRYSQHSSNFVQGLKGHDQRE